MTLAGYPRTSERPLSTHCCRLPTDYGWTAVDPQQPFASLSQLIYVSDGFKIDLL